MINGAQPCNVFWQVGSSATLGPGVPVTITRGATGFRQHKRSRGQAAVRVSDDRVFTETLERPGGRSSFFYFFALRRIELLHQLG